jgi:hypothetical protein
MPAMTALANLTLTGSQASISFTGFASSFRDLYIVATGNTPGNNAYYQVRYNGDTGANYSIQQQYGAGSAAAGGYQAFGLTSITPTGSGSNTELGSTTLALFALDIFDYSQTNKRKVAISRSSSSGNAINSWIGTWHNTAAITSISVFPSAGSFAAGNTFTLYGVI